jgi:hypothetical protein
MDYIGVNSGKRYEFAVVSYMGTEPNFLRGAASRRPICVRGAAWFNLPLTG